MPDPRHGVFETLLVLDGRPVELDAHLARLRASLASLFPNQPPPPLDVPVERGPYGHRSTGTSGRRALRIAVGPDRGGRLEARIEWRAARSPGSVSLRAVEVPGGLGAHKWVDRSLLDRIRADLPDTALPLIVDSDGAALEASRANLFAVRDGTLLTPPLDGRVLPGVTRMRVLELAAEAGVEAGETRLSRADLRTAEEVFLTGSVRGIEPVESLDGVALAGGGAIATRLSAALLEAWAGLSTAAPFG